MAKLRDGVTWIPSKNFTKAKAREITCVVLHATATSGMNSPLDWLANPASKVSAHYLIGKDGYCVQLVNEDDIAWHAGESEWKGRKHVNGFSIGIELVNANDGKDPWLDDQFEACAKLCAAILPDYGLDVMDIIRHLDIAPGRKTDPAGFPLDDFRIRVAELMDGGKE